MVWTLSADDAAAVAAATPRRDTGSPTVLGTSRGFAWRTRNSVRASREEAHSVAQVLTSARWTGPSGIAARQMSAPKEL